MLTFAAERVAGRVERWSLLRATRPADPEGQPSVYLNVGQDGLDRAERMAAMPCARAALIHDLIPLTHPEYDTPRQSALHAARLATLAAHADHVFTNSEATRRALLNACPEPRFSSSAALLAPALSPPGAPVIYERPTFVHLSSLNRRKNLALLLHVWREMAADPDAPDLVVIGRRGNDVTALELIDKAPALRHRVKVLGAVNDADAARHVAGATALLTPSFAEGFGLPIVEAHAMGVPVIASDIEAHREIGGPSTLYLSPLDGLGWQSEILRLAKDPAARESAAAAIPRPPTWEAHFNHVATVLRRLALGATGAP